MSKMQFLKTWIVEISITFLILIGDILYFDQTMTFIVGCSIGWVVGFLTCIFIDQTIEKKVSR